MDLSQIGAWFTGGDSYMRLTHCMADDHLWITITVVLDAAVATGYGLIALHWWKNQKRLQNVAAKRALGNLRNVFVFCGICGYAFIPIKMVWPAWRLYDMFLVVLVYYTWRFAWGARDLKVVYNELGRTEALASELQASREESRKKSFFLNAIGHDLRNPLYGVLLQADLAREALESNDRATLAEALDRIKLATKDTSELLNNFLELGRAEAVESIHRESVELSSLLQGLVTRHTSTASNKGLRLELSCPAGLTIRSDRTKLLSVLNNLLDNAIKFTTAGGVRAEVERANDDVAIHIIDTGEGIEPEDAQHIFDEFYQANNHERSRHKGYGLGLAITRRLCTLLGGTIDVESVPGRGSRFTVRLAGAGAEQPIALVASVTEPAIG